MHSISRIFLIIIACGLCVGCNTRKDFPENPQPIPCISHPENVRLALVLGGGGARGMAHVGVLSEFEKAGIPIDVIVGCSAGSIVGSLYADYPNAERLKKLLRPLRTWDILDISLIYCRYGFVQGKALTYFLNKNLSVKRIEELRIPLYIVATDIIEGKLVCMNAGPIIPAVRASCAVPLIFPPIPLYDRWLVDGGVADPVPASTARAIGAEIVVAVDLSNLLKRSCPSNLFGIASRAAEIKFLLQSESCAREADIVIRPNLEDMGLFDDKNLEKVYEAGEIAAREAIPNILELLRTHTPCPCHKI